MATRVAARPTGRTCCRRLAGARRGFGNCYGQPRAQTGLARGGVGGRRRLRRGRRRRTAPRAARQGRGGGGRARRHRPEARCPGRHPAERPPARLLARADRQGAAADHGAVRHLRAQAGGRDRDRVSLVPHRLRREPAGQHLETDRPRTRRRPAAQRDQQGRHPGREGRLRRRGLRPRPQDGQQARHLGRRLRRHERARRQGRHRSRQGPQGRQPLQGEGRRLRRSRLPGGRSPAADATAGRRLPGRRRRRRPGARHPGRRRQHQGRRDEGAGRGLRQPGAPVVGRSAARRSGGASMDRSIPTAASSTAACRPARASG